METKFIVRKRWFDETWNVEEIELTLEDYLLAGQVASGEAKALDKVYGDTAQWTVDLVNPKGGSYYQFFHGRTE